MRSFDEGAPSVRTLIRRRRWCGRDQERLQRNDFESPGSQTCPGQWGDIAIKLEEDASGILIRLVTDTRLGKMANVIDDKNVSQNDWDALECWVKNNEMTF